MNNPPTDHTNTAATKPSTMDTIKDKTATLVEKVTGRPHGHHDTTGLHEPTGLHDPTGIHDPTGQQTNATSRTVHDPAHLRDNKQNVPPHAGSTAAGTAIPRESAMDRAAYQQQYGQNIAGTNQPAAAATDPNTAQSSVDPRNQAATTTAPGSSAAGTAIPHGSAVDRAAYQKQYGQGTAGSNQPAAATTDPRYQTTTSTAPGSSAAGTAIPHGSAVDRAAYQQQYGQGTAGSNQPAAAATDPRYQTTTTTATGTSAPGGAPLRHPATAGPTGTGHVPTYSQNIPPAAAGTVPTGYRAEQVNDPNAKHLGDPNASHDNRHHNQNPLHHRDNDNKNATGAVVGAFPVNPNSSTLPVNNNNPQQATPVHSNNNTVPAMGAPGTTTAAGTHAPGEYTYVPCEYTGTKDFRGNVAPPPGSSMSAEINSKDVHPQ